MPKPGERAVVVVNHVSFLDGPLLDAILLGEPTFAVATKIAKAWSVKPLLAMFDAFRLVQHTVDDGRREDHVAHYVVQLGLRRGPALAGGVALNRKPPRRQNCQVDL